MQLTLDDLRKESWEKIRKFIKSGMCPKCRVRKLEDRTHHLCMECFREQEAQKARRILNRWHY